MSKGQINLNNLIPISTLWLSQTILSGIVYNSEFELENILEIQRKTFCWYCSMGAVFVWLCIFNWLSEKCVCVTDVKNIS